MLRQVCLLSYFAFLHHNSYVHKLLLHPHSRFLSLSLSLTLPLSQFPLFTVVMSYKITVNAEFASAETLPLEKHRVVFLQASCCNIWKADKYTILFHLRFCVVTHYLICVFNPYILGVTAQ